MDFELNIPYKTNIIRDEFFYRQTVEFTIDRPVQAWQWMNQSRSLPDQSDWVRPEVYDSWQRCLDDYQLPLGKFADWDHFPVQRHPVGGEDARTQQISRLLHELGHNFSVFLQEADIMLVLTRSDGCLLGVLGEKPFSSPLLDRISHPSACWAEDVLGNNGIGSAAVLKKPVAFQGMEHFLCAFHPFTTVGYPLLDDAEDLLAVIGLICGHQESMNALFAFLHLICIMVNTNLPLAHSREAQARVLEKIPLKAVNRQSPTEPTISAELNALLNKAVKLQSYKIPILITGESGVGKDHFVNLLKNAGPRHNRALIAINCASIPHDLIESELFGYEAGSFTGAKINGKPGKFLLADKGILFLDEIGDMSLELQTSLLRVLETSEFTPVGGSKPIRVDVQIVAATNVNLLNAVEAGRFRNDLYYRLNGAQIHLSPLRDRSDKKMIIRHIIQSELAKLPDSANISIAPEVIDLLERHPWPGNIRQLINVLRATIYTSEGPMITCQDLPTDFLAKLDTTLSLTAARQAISHESAPEPAGNGNMSLLEWEKYGIKAALKNCEGNITLAAKKLGITRTTLYKKIERYGLNDKKVVATL